MFAGIPLVRPFVLLPKVELYVHDVFQEYAFVSAGFRVLVVMVFLAAHEVVQARFFPVLLEIISHLPDVALRALRLGG